MHINKFKKYYFISKFDTNNIDKQDKQTTIIYRNYSKKTEDQTLILKIKKYCKKKSIDFYLSNNVRLAIKLNLDGAYIPSFNTSLRHLSYSYKKKFKIVGSAHNLKEIRIKENQNVRKIFLSSLFKKNIYTYNKRQNANVLLAFELELSSLYCTVTVTITPPPPKKMYWPLRPLPLAHLKLRNLRQPL